MEWKSEEFLIRYVRLRDELMPVPNYLLDDKEPLRPDWLAIARTRIWNSRRPEGIENFALYLLLDDGTQLDWYEFETLEIAFDQAKGIAGVLHHEWRECHLKSPREDGGFKWTDVAPGT